MDSEPLSSSANFIGLATGVTSLLGLAFCRSYFPKYRYGALEVVLNDTENIWAAESSHIGNRENIQERLASLRRDVYKHRERALGNITVKHQCKEFFKGLSIVMSRTCSEIEVVRAQIITAAASEAERRRLQGIGSESGSPVPEISVESSSTDVIRSSVIASSIAAKNDTAHDYPPLQPVSEQAQEGVFPVPLANMVSFSPLNNPGFYPNMFPTLGIRGSGDHRQKLNNFLQMRFRTSSSLTWKNRQDVDGTWTAIAYIHGVEYGCASHSTLSGAREEAARQTLIVLANPV